MRVEVAEMEEDTEGLLGEFHIPTHVPLASSILNTFFSSILIWNLLTTSPLPEALRSLAADSAIVDKDQNKKILKRRNVGYLLKRSKSRSCYQFSNPKYNSRILGSAIEQFLATEVWEE